MQDAEQASETAHQAPAEPLVNQIPMNAEDAYGLIQSFSEQIISYLPSVLGAILVFMIGMWIAGRIRSIVKKIFERTDHFDETVESFLASLIYYAAVALVLVTTLGMFGVQTTSLAAIIGAAGLAIGLALQGTLGHLASGVMLLSFRPFNIGDFVETAGHAGTIKAITLFTTEMATVDNKKIIIPNGAIWADSIVNFSAHATRRVDFVFGVSYDDDLNKALAAIKSEVEKETRAHKTPEPVIEVDNLGDSSVDIICRVWVNSGDYFPVKWGLTKAVKERFDAEGISIPYPTTTIVQTAA